MEQKITEAVLSYEKPKQYLNSAKLQITKTFGKDAILFLNMSTSMIKYNTIIIPIKYNNSNVILNLKNNKISVFFSRGF